MEMIVRKSERSSRSSSHLFFIYAPLHSLKLEGLLKRSSPYPRSPNPRRHRGRPRRRRQGPPPDLPSTPSSPTPCVSRVASSSSSPGGGVESAMEPSRMVWRTFSGGSARRQRSGGWTPVRKVAPAAAAWGPGMPVRAGRRCWACSDGWRGRVWLQWRPGIVVMPAAAARWAAGLRLPATWWLRRGTAAVVVAR
jgi:hypothetical protein